MRERDEKAKIPLRECIRITMRGYGLVRLHFGRLMLAMALLSIVEALTPYVGIFLSARLIDEIAGPRNASTIAGLMLISLVSAAVLALGTAGLRRWKAALTGTQWHSNNRIFSQKLLSMDFASVDDPKTHDLLSQIDQNNNWSGWGINKLIWSFEKCVKAVMTIIGAAILSVTLFTLHIPDGAGALVALNHPAFIVAVITVMLLVTIAAPALSNKAGGYWASYAKTATMGNRIFSYFGFIGYKRSRALDIRVYRQDRLFNHLLSLSGSFGQKSPIAKKARGPMGLLQAASGAVSQVFLGFVYVFVCLKAWGGAFGVGAVTQYVGAITALSGGISSLLSELGSLRNNVPYLCTVFEFLDIPNDMYQGSLSVEKRSDGKFEIEFRNVSFKYPSAADYALRNVSLSFEIGQRLAIVGMNGSGKTTFIKLLCRLYDPTEGEILLNGIDIRKYSYEEYMRIFSVVFQDFQLLAFTLGENVAASMAIDHARAEKCLDRAGFGERVSRMPKGLDTCLYKDFDEEGVEISGGEAQKIALARALYKDAAFIILDEPTAALDPVAEFEVYSRMNEIVESKTAVFISHRLSSCRFCHDIAVFHEGRLIQRGSHEALVADTGGKYQELWNAQAQYYAREGED